MVCRASYRKFPIRSTKRGTVRFLDYLGLERQDDKPLLIVETKRPSEALPCLRITEPGDELMSAAEVLCDGLRGSRLLGDWNEWLDTLSDYVRSLHEKSGHYPRRVMLTNGEWLIIFRDVVTTILSDTPDAAGIWVLPNFRAFWRSRLGRSSKHSIITQSLPNRHPSGPPNCVFGQMHPMWTG